MLQLIFKNINTLTFQVALKAIQTFFRNTVNKLKILRFQFTNVFN